MYTVTIQAMRHRAKTEPFSAAICAQVARRSDNQTRDGSPFIELELTDATGSERCKLWQDSAAFHECHKAQITVGSCVRLFATWSFNDFGLNLKQPELTLLLPLEEKELFAGDSEAEDRRWFALRTHLLSIRPRLLSDFCLDLAGQWEPEFRRAAAARNNHHSRRGGLLEHTLSMLEAGQRLAPHYPEVCPGLLAAGIFLHDAFKMSENGYPAQGFRQEPSRSGVMHGHIAIGYGVVLREWTVRYGNQSIELRDHLLHLILSHHGQRDWGSPVEPMTPEAFMLHYLDNLDAKIESLRISYRNPDTTPGICDASKPLWGSVARPWSLSAEAAAMEEMEKTNADNPDSAALPKAEVSAETTA